MVRQNKMGHLLACPPLSRLSLLNQGQGAYHWPTLSTPVSAITNSGHQSLSQDTAATRTDSYEECRTHTLNSCPAYARTPGCIEEQSPWDTRVKMRALIIFIHHNKLVPKLQKLISLNAESVSNAYTNKCLSFTLLVTDILTIIVQNIQMRLSMYA